MGSKPELAIDRGVNCGCREVWCANKDNGGVKGAGRRKWLFSLRDRLPDENTIGQYCGLQNN
jgi:hypothetical protein